MITCHLAYAVFIRFSAMGNQANKIVVLVKTLCMMVNLIFIKEYTRTHFLPTFGLSSGVKIFHACAETGFNDGGLRSQNRTL